MMALDLEAVKLGMFFKTEQIEYVRIGELEVQAEELNELFEKLDATDGLFSAVVMYDKPLERKLIAVKVIKKTTRGSVYRGDEFESFRKIVHEMLRGECHCGEAAK
jgi:hypothetical protein